MVVEFGWKPHLIKKKASFNCDPIANPMMGENKSVTIEVTIAVNAAPITIPTLMHMTNSQVHHITSLDKLFKV